MASHPSRTRHLAVRALLLASFVVAAAVFTGTTIASTSPGALPVHGSVAAWVDEHPGEPVPLIVQHDGTPEDLLAFISDSGGTVEREFHIIPALDVNLPADQVNLLAVQGDVDWISLDAPVQSTDDHDKSVVADVLATAYPYSINAPEAWNSATGAGVTVALIDTGVSDDAKEDFYTASGDLRVYGVSVNPELSPSEDGYGHGTHVGGIIAGFSTQTEEPGEYTGIAPEADLLSIRIADDDGNATVGDLMAGLEYVDDYREEHNIRVLNLSVTSSVAQSYTVDPIDAAVELLWFHDIVVVVAAGNDGDAADAVHYPPANDPFVITVGAFDDQGTQQLQDDRLADWSSRGTTQDGFAKPEVVAPGANIVSPVSPGSYLATNHPEAVVDDSGNASYFRMSGTSMATGVVSGLAALVRQAHPEWTPGEVKDVLLETARSVKGTGHGVKGQGVLANEAVNFNGQPESADDGLVPSYLLLAAALEIDEVVFDGIRWRGIRWRDGFEVYFDGIRWRDANFEGIRWRGLELNGIRWRDVDWTGIRWRGIEFSGIRWRDADVVDLDGIRWRGIRWRGFVED